MDQNLVMNPSLISMSPEEFDEHVTRITQAQARADHSKFHMNFPIWQVGVSGGVKHRI